jgi:hypothetical protein
MKKRHVLATAAVIALAGGTTAALATIPGGDGVISGCYKKYSGELRLIDTASKTCKSWEIPIAWNQTGPAGPAGAQGPQARRATPGLEAR